jgi:hypothetical protein
MIKRLAFPITLAATILLSGQALAVHGPFSASGPNGISRPPAGPNGSPDGRTDTSKAGPGVVGERASGAAKDGPVIDGSNHGVIESIFPGQTPGLFPGGEPD